jgi:poly-gamma-glutamate synthesis protein (capsule biosynthesis protein)
MLARTVGDRLVAAPPVDPFAAVAPILRDADVAVGNLECAIGTTGAPAKKAFTFRAPPAAAGALAAAGIDVVSLANNHVLDFGPDALRETIALLDAAGIAHAGAGMTEADAHAPAHVRARGKTLAFLGYVKVPVEGLLPGGFDTATWEAHGDAPGVAWADPKRIAADVAAARAGADLVVVMLHSGFEGESAPNIWQIDAARAAIDAGASLVVGAHPHVLQGAARYKAGFIAYSLGNFVFDGTDVPSAILQVTLDEPGAPGAVSWTPVLVRHGFPELVDEQTGAYVRNLIKGLSMPL